MVLMVVLVLIANVMMVRVSASVKGVVESLLAVIGDKPNTSWSCPGGR